MIRNDCQVSIENRVCLCVCISACLSLSVCVRIRVCMGEREKQRETDRQTDCVCKKRDTTPSRPCVCQLSKLLVHETVSTIWSLGVVGLSHLSNTQEVRSSILRDFNLILCSLIG